MRVVAAKDAARDTTSTSERQHGDVGSWDHDFWLQYKQRLQHGHQEISHHSADKCPDDRSDDHDPNGFSDQQRPESCRSACPGRAG